MPDEILDFAEPLPTGCLFDPGHAAALVAAQPIQSYQALPRESGLGKKRFLWEYQRIVLGRDFTEPQTSGTCAAKCIQRAIMMLWSIRIALQGMAEQIPGVPASEPLYALGRHEIGRDQLGRGGGLVISWGLQAAVEYGIILRGVYGNIDLSKPNDRLADAWGAPRVGCPDELEPIGRDMPIKAFVPIRSWEEGCTAMYNGEPLMFGSNDIPNPGRTPRRDARGYYIMDASGGHARIYSGFDDTPGEGWWYEDNGSWPAAVGPNPVDGPACGGKISRQRVESRFRQGEVYALSDVTGMPKQNDELDFVLN